MAVAEPPPGRAPHEEFDGGRPMTIIEHLLELRTRLIICCLALVVGVAISSVFTNQFFDFLLRPAREQAPEAEIVSNRVLGNFVIYFHVALLGGLIISMPILVWQTLLFVLPGLTPKEQRWVLPIVFGIFVCFLIGAAFAYYIALPRAVDFLLNFNSHQFKNIIPANDYLSFATRMIFWIGVSFELPIFMLALARFGIVTGRKLLSWWRYMIVLVFLAAAIITPTPDPLTQSLVAGPLLVLYGVGTLLAFIFGQKRPRT